MYPFLSLLGSVAIGVGGAIVYMERQKQEWEQEIVITKIRQQHQMDMEKVKVLSEEKREKMKFARICLAKKEPEECMRSFNEVMKEFSLN